MWKNYQLIYKKPLSTPLNFGVSNIDNRYLDTEWTKTNVKFKARNRDEGMKKAQKLWEMGQFGMGSIDILVIE